MQINRWFILGIVLFLGLMFVVEYNMPKKFIWTPTFAHTDRQPFGCAVFDDVVEKSLPDGGYSLSKETFYQMNQVQGEPRGILSITQDLSLTETDTKAVFELAQRGNILLLVSNSFGAQLSDSLHFTTTYSYFNAADLKRYALSLNKRDSLLWQKDSVYGERTFRFYPQLCLVKILPNDSCMLTSIVDKSSLSKVHEPVAMSYQVGKGEIICVTTPLLFTNYGVLDKEGNADYLFRFLNRMKGLPVVRTEVYMKQAEVTDSPLRYFLSQRPLRWALYLTLTILLLFMIFTARRRQRVIPVVHKPVNKNLEFTELIGTLYYQKRNHADLVCKKFVYFAENLRRNYQIDVEDDSNDTALVRQIALKTGGDETKTLELLRLLRPVVQGRKWVDEAMMCKLIDGMDNITTKN